MSAIREIKTELPGKMLLPATNIDTNLTTNSTVHNGREARNLAEKQRRDKLNASIQELSTMVPHVAESTRRLDKTAVLRFAAHGFRLQHVFGKSAVRRKRLQQQQPHTLEMLMQLMDSFFITLTCHGQIVLVSETVEQLLGHCRLDLYGQNILNFIHVEDQAFIQQQLIPHDLEILFNKCTGNNNNNNNNNNSTADNNSSENSDDNKNEENWSYQRARARRQFADIDKRLRKDRRSFTVRMARASTRSESMRTYEIVKFDGCFRRSDHSAAESGNTFPIVAQLIRRSRNSSNCGIVGSGINATGVNYLQHDAIAQAALHGISGNDIVFVGMARIIRPPKLNIYPLNNTQLEYRTRHLIDGRIVDCDQRIGIVAGYMKDEVKNLSPFSFMHQDDVRWVIVALRQMYDCNSDYGESCYRLLTRNGNFIYLQTRGYMEIDKCTNKVHSFVCINTLLDEQEGRKRVQQMKDKFSVIIQAKIPSNSLQDVPASQNPQQLERIVLYLIENLQKRNDESTTMGGEEQNVIPPAKSPASITVASPLSLVPPEPASVRNSISRSVSVVQQQYNQKSPSSHFGSSEASLSPASTTTENYDEILDSSNTSLPRNCVVQILNTKIRETQSSPTSSTTNEISASPVNVHDTVILKRINMETMQDNSNNSTPIKRNCNNISPATSPNFNEAVIKCSPIRLAATTTVNQTHSAHMGQQMLLNEKSTPTVRKYLHNNLHKTNTTTTTTATNTPLLLRSLRKS